MKTENEFKLEFCKKCGASAKLEIEYDQDSGTYYKSQDKYTIKCTVCDSSFSMIGRYHIKYRTIDGWNLLNKKDSSDKHKVKILQFQFRQLGEKSWV